jgi:hypothetical protein
VQLPIKPGIIGDIPWATDPNGARWVSGFNVRFRLGSLETIGLNGALQDIAGNEIQVPMNASQPVRTLLSSPFPGGIQILAGAVNQVAVVSANQASTPTTGTRYGITDITPAGLPALPDIVPNPSLGVVHIAHDWFYLVDGDRIFAARSDADEEPWYWDRNLGSNLVQLAADTPSKAVAGAISDGILVLMGCDAFDPLVDNRMTIRWADRYNWEEWEPTPTTTAGEYQVSNGSRIMGGGLSSHGVVAWTDTSMYLLESVGDIDTVFSLEDVSSSHGLLANHAWTETEGVIYWVDQHRKLCKYSGGRVDVIVNPIKLATLERVDDTGLPRIYMSSNVEYTEVLTFFPASVNDEPNRALDFNYKDDAWSLWALARTAWTPRAGAQDVLGIAPDGTVYAQDLDVSLPSSNIAPLSSLPAVALSGVPSANNVEPFDWEIWTSLVNSGSPAWETHGFNRVAVATLNSSATGAEADTWELTARSYQNMQVSDEYMQELYSFSNEQSIQDIRTEGRSLQLGFSGRAVKTVTRIGMIDLASAEPVRGQR